jgi:hypothetical protein
MTEPTRKLIARHTGLVTRELVYETADGVEIETVDHYEVTRRRVFFDDVVLVTYHRQIGALFIFLNLLVVFFFVATGAVGASAMRGMAGWSFLLAFALLAAPSFVAIVIRLILRVDVINVFGRRSKATLRFSFRKRRAREVYGRICARARQVQRVTEPAPAEEHGTTEGKIAT